MTHKRVEENYEKFMILYVAEERKRKNSLAKTLSIIKISYDFNIACSKQKENE